MALLLQMTSENSGTPTRKVKSDMDSPCSAPKSVNRRNERGETPLHVAAIRGDVQKLRALISQGADVNTEDYAGISIAIKLQSTFLTNFNSLPGWTPLHEAANRGLGSVARELLKNGAKVNVTGLDGVTPLHDASVNGHENLVAILLRYGANPSLKTSSNKTALDLAASPQIVKLLAQKSIDQQEGIVDENSPEEASPYHLSTENSWKIQKQNPKSRRSLRLGKFQPTFFQTKFHLILKIV